MILHTYIQYEFKCMHVNQTRLRRSRDIYTPYIVYCMYCLVSVYASVIIHLIRSCRLYNYFIMTKRQMKLSNSSISQIVFSASVVVYDKYLPYRGYISYIEYTMLNQTRSQTINENYTKYILRAILATYLDKKKKIIICILHTLVLIKLFIYSI